MARILVAEDDPDIASLLGHYLQRAGFEADLVPSGFDVLPRIRKAPPDLLLLDIMLPGLDGLEVCRAVRGDEHTAAIPIIMITAKAEESDRIVRMLRVAAMGESVFGEPGRFWNWFRAPKRRFDGRTPLSLLATAAGSRVVEDLLGAIDEGFAA